jgi:hypothetical protein
MAAIDGEGVNAVKDAATIAAAWYVFADPNQFLVPGSFVSSASSPLAKFSQERERWAKETRRGHDWRFATLVKESTSLMKANADKRATKQ